jgi:formylmethanofuran dehydrogenase subunit E
MASYRSGKLVFLLVARDESSAVLLTVRAQKGRYSQQNAKERKREHKRRVDRGLR